MELTITARTGVTYVPFIRKHLLAAHRILRSPLRELSVALVGDATMSRLHEQFMNIPGPTDVLTFPLEFIKRGIPSSGEVVVCVPEARRQARERRIAVRHELLLYAIHGLLHLSGFDDRNARQYNRMHRMEDTILRRLGVGPVFATVNARGRR